MHTTFPRPPTTSYRRPLHQNCHIRSAYHMSLSVTSPHHSHHPSQSHHVFPLTTTSPCPPMHPVPTTQHLSHSVEHSTTSVTSSSPTGRHNTAQAIFPSTHHPVSHKQPLAHLPVYHIILSAATPRLPHHLVPHVNPPATTPRLSQHPIPTPSITSCQATKPVLIKPSRQYLSQQPVQPVQCSQHHQFYCITQAKTAQASTSPLVHPPTLPATLRSTEPRA